MDGPPSQNQTDLEGCKQFGRMGLKGPLQEIFFGMPGPVGGYHRGRDFLQVGLGTPGEKIGETAQRGIRQLRRRRLLRQCREKPVNRVGHNRLIGPEKLSNTIQSIQPHPQ